MISKKNRLQEREVKKVLKTGKPFFSYNLVFNVVPNTLGYSRYAVIISGKSVPNNVVRNIYRRMFYEICRPYILTRSVDIACVIKVKTQLTIDLKTQKSIRNEILYLFENKIGKNI